MGIERLEDALLGEFHRPGGVHIQDVRNLARQVECHDLVVDLRIGHRLPFDFDVLAGLRLIEGVEHLLPLLLGDLWRDPFDPLQLDLPGRRRRRRRTSERRSSTQRTAHHGGAAGTKEITTSRFSVLEHTCLLSLGEPASLLMRGRSSLDGPDRQARDEISLEE